MPISWNIPLVILSILIAMIGSFTALTHAQRMRESNGLCAWVCSWVWLCTGGLTLGVTIWTTHFIGMLAFHLPTQISYDIPLTLLSGAFAIAAALLGFYLLCTPELKVKRIAGGGVLMGLGISAMHYTGMAALEMSPPIIYSLPIVALSVLIAIAAALGALLLVYASEKHGWNYWLRYGAGGVIMGSAIAGMHYTGMAAAEFSAGSICLSGASRIEPELLAMLVSMGALTLFAGGMLASLFDQRMAWQKSQALAQLQVVHAELEQRARHMAESMTRDLHASHNMLNLVLDAVPQSIFWKDRNGVYLGCNKVFAQDAGLAHPEEVIGKTDFDLPWTQAEAEAFRADDAEVMRSNAAKPHIIQQQHNADGKQVWLDTSKVPLTNGEMLGVLSVYEDVTARRAAEAQIKRLTELYAALSQCNQAIVRCTSEEELFQEICRDAVQFGGMKMAWIGLLDEASRKVKPVACYGSGIEYLDGIEISDDADEPSGRGPIGIVMRGGQPYWCQDYLNEPLLVLWHERGARYGWAASAVLPLHRQGKVIGVFMLYAGEVNAFDELARNLLVEMAMDIGYALDRFILQAEKGQVLEALRESEARTRLILDTAMDAVVSADQEGRVTGWNREAERMFGYAADQAIGKELAELIVPPVHRQAHRQGMQRYVETGSATIIGKRIEIIGMHADGSEFPIELTIAAAQRRGQYLFNAFVRDISARKRSEIAIRKHEADLAQFKSTLDQSLDGVYIFQPDTLCFAYVNRGAMQQVGYSEGELLQMTPLDIKPEFTEQHFREKLKGLQHGSTTVDTFETVHRHKDGHDIPVEIVLQLVHHGEIGGRFIAFSRDISERKRAEETLRIAASTFEIQQAILITDADANILRVNQAFQDITGYCEEDLIGKNPRVFQSGQHDAAFYQDMWTALLGKGKWSGEIWDRRKSGEIYPKSMTITAVHDDEHRVSHYVSVFRDISNRKKSEQEIHQLAFYDPLTQLPNRRLLMDRLQQAMVVSMRNGHYGALLFLDLDHFKTINDTQGHAMGDLLLIEVAHRLQASVREGDSVARLGGDEFVVLLEELSSQTDVAAAQAELVAEKVRNELNRTYLLKDYECHTTPSIGICLFLGNLDGIEDLLKHADVAMYQAKSSGRNAIRFFDPKMQMALDMRAKLEADLIQALAKQQFQLYYQVQVDSLQRPLGAEALIRWQHPERGLVYPDQFIPLAEENGLIVPIGLWVLQAACAQLNAWQNDALTRDLTLAVNVSARQLRQPDFVSQVQRTLLTSGAKPSSLKLELTESTVLENVDDTIAKMREIKILGVNFSMDDFGTGYSSLQYLKRLPLDQIKIDRSFVSDITSDPNDAAIVQTIIAMTRALGLNVIAEGVETTEQLEFLNLRGCHAFQGYLFGKPVPIELFNARLNSIDGERTT
ncbi:MAG: PAS/PAC sensor-containing diguanylate cyclase/phosphodiesterase [Gallionellaceae bacterium]|nr:MAG: PAS/PAC sensor-containing diguanylate cyclase/phosphodiesterase [Gallionellaceae bacterium]